MTTSLPTKPKTLSAAADLGVEEPYRTNRLLSHMAEWSDYSTAIARCAIEALERCYEEDNDRAYLIANEALAKIRATGWT